MSSRPRSLKPLDPTHGRAISNWPAVVGGQRARVVLEIAAGVRSRSGLPRKASRARERVAAKRAYGP
jgi:hypothetical protein